MLNGHAYARAVRAHTLLQLALLRIISKNINIDDGISVILKTSIEGVMKSTVSYKDIESSDCDV